MTNLDTARRAAAALEPSYLAELEADHDEALAGSGQP